MGDTRAYQDQSTAGVQRPFTIIITSTITIITICIITICIITTTTTTTTTTISTIITTPNYY